jgi:protocatechuate 3,4-dioxygenase beta subunit
VYGLKDTASDKVWGRSGVDGRFRFSVPRSRVDAMRSDIPWREAYVLAAADGHGFAVAGVDAYGAPDLTLRLVRDDLPLRGRILSLEGRPVAGARVRIDELYVPNGRNLDRWLTAPRNVHSSHVPSPDFYLTELWGPALQRLFPPVTTGRDGRFEFRGIGRERIVGLRLEGPTITTRIAQVIMRPGAGLRLPKQEEFRLGPRPIYYPASFDHLAFPSRPVVGVVRDRDTGEPLAGVTIQSSRSGGDFDMGLLESVTDQAGRFRLTGLPKGGENQIEALVRNLPYLAGVRDVPDSPGLGPVTVDFALKRGLWILGRVTDMATGKPVKAHVSYSCFADNPQARVITELVFGDGCWTKADGSFRVAGLPGPGLIAVSAYSGRFRMGVGAEAIKGPRDGKAFRTAPVCFSPANYNALAAVCPKDGEGAITRDLTVDPGRLVTGTVLGPDGKPLAGARVAGLIDEGRWEPDPLAGASFQIWVLPPDEGAPWRLKPRLLQFVHEGKHLAGSVIVSTNATAPLAVKLVPWGTATGRVVGPGGKPLSGVELTVRRLDDRSGEVDGGFHPTRAFVTDENGKFRVEGLVPGLKYDVGVMQGAALVGRVCTELTVESGENRDLGDLRVRD